MPSGMATVAGVETGPITINHTIDTQNVPKEDPNQYQQQQPQTVAQQEEVTEPSFDSQPAEATLPATSRRENYQDAEDAVEVNKKPVVDDLNESPA